MTDINDLNLDLVKGQIESIHRYNELKNKYDNLLNELIDLTVENNQNKKQIKRYKDIILNRKDNISSNKKQILKTKVEIYI